MKRIFLSLLIISFGFSASWVWLWDGKMGLSPDSFATDVPLLFLSAKTGGGDTTVVKSDSVKVSGYVYIYNGTKRIWALGDSLVLYNSTDGQSPSNLCFGGT